VSAAPPAVQLAAVGSGFTPRVGRLESADDPQISQLEWGSLVTGPEVGTTVLFDKQRGLVRYSVRLWPQTPSGARAMLRMLLVRRLLQRLGIADVIGRIVLLRGTAIVSRTGVEQPVYGFGQEWTVANATGRPADEYLLTGSGNSKVRLSQLMDPTNGTFTALTLKELGDEVLQRDLYRRIPDSVYEHFCIAMFVLSLWDVAPRNIVFQFRADGSVIPRWVDIEDGVLGNWFALRFTNLRERAIDNFIGWKDVRATSTALGDKISAMNIAKEFNPEERHGLFRSLSEEVEQKERTRDSHVDYLGMSAEEAFKADFPDIPDLATPPKTTIWVRRELNDELWNQLGGYARRPSDVASFRAKLQQDPLLAPPIVQKEAAPNLAVRFPPARAGSDELFYVMYRKFESPGTEMLDDGTSAYLSSNLSSRLGKLQALYAAIGAAVPGVPTAPGFSSAFGALIEQQRNNHQTGQKPKS